MKSSTVCNSASGLREPSPGTFIYEVSRSTIILFLIVFATLSMAGCAGQQKYEQPFTTYLNEADSLGECARLFESLDTAAEQHGVTDRQDHRLRGFPYLRINRFLASMADVVIEEPAFSFWLDQLLNLDRQARQYEIANLPEQPLNDIKESTAKTDLAGAVEKCGDRLRQADFSILNKRVLLLDEARVPPNYNTSKSVLGLYPFTSLFVRLGIFFYQKEIHKTYQMPLNKLAVEGRLIRYEPAESSKLSFSEVASLLAAATLNPLSTPELSPAAKELLFNTFAPVWEIDASGNHDLIGAPVWKDTNKVGVDTTKPSVYTLVSRTRFNGEILLQLNYIIWFSERPEESFFDIFSGRLDGIIWRVTLGMDGFPLFYDTIHNCGCYHMFFPHPAIAERKKNDITEEPVLVPQRMPDNSSEKRLVIRVASRTHYVQRIYRDSQNANTKIIPYIIKKYKILRSLPLENNMNRSLFNNEGLVPGTERKERLLLWITGVDSPGAMRQWGNHAVAFFGRRHFDDPELFDTLFELRGISPEYE